MRTHHCTTTASLHVLGCVGWVGPTAIATQAGKSPQMSEESCMMQGLSLQSQPSPPAEGLGLLGLPEHLLGRIFSCIDGQEWAHNFYSSCRAIRDSPSVNQAIHAFDLELAGPPLLYPHPLQNWPRRATLKKLSVDARADGDAKQCALVNFLGPLCLTEYEGVDLKRVCRTVEHLSMEVRAGRVPPCVEVHGRVSARLPYHESEFDRGSPCCACFSCACRAWASAAYWDLRPPSTSPRHSPASRTSPSGHLPAKACSFRE